MLYLVLIGMCDEWCFLSFKNFDNFLNAYNVETLILIFEFFMALHINSFLFIILEYLGHRAMLGNLFACFLINHLLYFDSTTC